MPYQPNEACYAYLSFATGDIAFFRLDRRLWSVANAPELLWTMRLVDPGIIKEPMVRWEDTFQ